MVVLGEHLDLVMEELSEILLGQLEVSLSFIYVLEFGLAFNIIQLIVTLDTEHSQVAPLEF